MGDFLDIDRLLDETERLVRDTVREFVRGRILPEIGQSGERIGCLGLTEPDSGSDPGSMRTRARRDGSHRILQGQKMWITNGSIADVAVVWARTDEGPRGFLVPKGTPGHSLIVGEALTGLTAFR